LKVMKLVTISIKATGIQDRGSGAPFLSKAIISIACFRWKCLA